MNETPEQFIERVRAYTEKATDAPWTATRFVTPKVAYVEAIRFGGDGEPLSSRVIVCEFPVRLTPGGRHAHSRDAEFVGYARQDLPAALSIIATLVRERDEARAELGMLRMGFTPSPCPFCYSPTDCLCDERKKGISL